METAKAKDKSLRDVISLVDNGGDIDERSKEMFKELKAIKEELMDEACSVCQDGTVFRLIGNVYQADVAFTPEFDDLEGVEAEIDAIDAELGRKVAPFNDQATRHEFTGDEDAIKELRKIDPALTKRLFKRIPKPPKREVSTGEISKLLRNVGKDPKKIEAAAALGEHVTSWVPKSVSFSTI